MIQACIQFFRYIRSFLISQKVEEQKSEVSGRLEVFYTKGTYVLDTANVNYSFGGLHTIFQNAFRQCNIKVRNIHSVLILGFGSGSVASILEREYKMKVAIVGVEKDEAVLALAKKYFTIDTYQNLTLHCADAYDFVLTASLPPFDLIVVDIFVDLLVPEKFRDEKFISALSKLISPQGILFYNFIAKEERSRDAGGKLYKQLTSLIGKTDWIRLFAKSTENWVFVCNRTSSTNQPKGDR